MQVPVVLSILIASAISLVSGWMIKEAVVFAANATPIEATLRVTATSRKLGVKAEVYVPALDSTLLLWLGNSTGA